MIDDPFLLNDWHPVASIHQLQTQPLLRTRLLGEDLLVWQTGEAIRVWRDLCIHRGARLSAGTVSNGCLACPYHGWRYDRSGACVYIPAAAQHLTTLWLCVWQANQRAIDFYQRFGFTIVGTTNVYVDEVVFADWVMQKSIQCDSRSVRQ